MTPFCTVSKKPRRKYILLKISMIFFLMTAGVVGIQLVTKLVAVKLDDIIYGMPRLYQVNAVVGHNDLPKNPTHFIAMNYQGQINVIEIPGGDMSHETMYMVPCVYLSNEDTPVTLTFTDENGDGKPDMLIHVGDVFILYLNTGTKFVSSYH